MFDQHSRDCKFEYPGSVAVLRSTDKKRGILMDTPFPDDEIPGKMD
jgi:hypothetical protein